MHRNLHLAVILVIAGTVLVVLTVRRVPDPDVRRMVERLDELEGWVQSLDRRLDEYLLGDSPLDAGDGPDDGSAEDDASEDFLSESGDDVPTTLAAGVDSAEELESVKARLRDLDLRVRGLEVDPVERGYSFLESDNPSLRRQGVLLLKRVAAHDRQALEALRDMLQDPDRRVRITTMDALGDVKDREALPSIKELLADPEATVRREAIFGLLRLGGREQGDSISQMLDDPDGAVRAKAAYALGRLKYGESTDALIAALQDADERVRGEVILSLGTLEDTKALPVLRDLYDNDPGVHRYRLVRALKGLGDGQPFEKEYVQLTEIFETEESADARLEAIRALSWFARDRAKELFKKAARDSNSRVRNEARRALGWSNGSRRRSSSG